MIHSRDKIVLSADNPVPTKIEQLPFISHTALQKERNIPVYGSQSCGSLQLPYYSSQKEGKTEKQTGLSSVCSAVTPNIEY